MPTDIATRALVVTLKAPAGAAKTTVEIHQITGLSTRTINEIYARAIRRGFEPNERPFRLSDKYLEDAPRSGRPRKRTEETSDLVISKVSRDRFGREKTAADIAGELSLQGIDISKTTVTRILKAAGFRKTKPTRKPGLTTKMRKERLQWCLDHQNWSLEDWKAVIWSDETSVILLHRRGGYRIWRRAEERFLRSCIRERWKGSSEFIFWAAFSYDKKGPYHCWRPETAKEKKEAEAALTVINEALEPAMKTQWEITNGMQRLGLRNKPGKKTVWRWNKANVKLVREGKGGIDWWRYQQHILIPKLLPFAKECIKERKNTVIQEDRAPAHSHHAQQRVFDLWEVQRLLWCPNSPDLNAIEPAWPWMKRYTTKKGAPKNRSEAIQRWEEAWRDLPQEKIQAWIERIPVHIQKIIDLKGGNEYLEGRDKCTETPL
jgi:transposase